MGKIILGLVLMALFTFASCGKANGNSTYAQSIPGGNSGTTCYVIYSNGSAVGGSCVKE